MCGLDYMTTGHLCGGSALFGNNTGVDKPARFQSMAQPETPQERRRYALLQAAAVLEKMFNLDVAWSVLRAEMLLAEIERREKENA